MIEGRYAGSLSRAWVQLRRILGDFGDLPIPLRAAGVGALVMGLSTLMPWYDFGPLSSRGLESNGGLLIMAIAIATVVVLAPLYRNRSPSAPGVLAALALFALVLHAAEGFEVNRTGGDSFVDDTVSLMWGYWASVSGGVLLLLSALILWGGPNPLQREDSD